jgi:hypothetical protein
MCEKLAKLGGKQILGLLSSSRRTEWPSDWATRQARAVRPSHMIQDAKRQPHALGFLGLRHVPDIP